MKFKLPQLHLGVLTDMKAGDTDARRYIHVVAGHAILQNEVMIVVNLREYVKMECNISDKSDFDELTDIIEWMEGKSFTKEWWMNFTKEQFISLHDEGLEIEHATYEKLCKYEDVLCDTDTMLASLRDNIDNPPVTIDTVAVSGINFSLIGVIFKTEMKVDNFIFDFRGKDRPIRFSAQRKIYIFGLLPTNYSAAIEIMGFENMTDFKAKLDEVL